jgi:hypothetical protein
VVDRDRARNSRESALLAAAPPPREGPLLRPCATTGHLPRWRIVEPLLRLIPRPVRNAAYDLVARHRYRIAGMVDACPIPPPEWRDRFLA